MAFDLLYYVCPPNGKQYRLFGLGDENCQCFQADDGWIEFRKNRHMEEFYVTESVIGRGADTSEISTDGVHPTERFYIQYTRNPDGSLTYGAAWAKRLMDVGDRFSRKCHVIRFRADGTIFEEYDDQSDLVVNAHHPSLLFPQSSITIEDVLELQWGGEEVYYYAKDFGLVGWKNLRTDQGSFVGVLGATIQDPFSHPISRPTVAKPPMPEQPKLVLDAVIEAPGYPDGTAPQQAQINHKDGLWLLGQPADRTTRIRVLLYQEEITVFQEPVIAAGDYQWQRVTTGRGENGWSANFVDNLASFGLLDSSAVEDDAVTEVDAAAQGTTEPEVAVSDVAAATTGDSAVSEGAAAAVVQPIFFRVKGSRVKIRHEAGLTGTLVDQVLDPGDIIEVDPASSTALDGYVWWKHALGWSAEKTDDGAASPEILMEQVDRTSTIQIAKGREIEPSALFDVEPVALGNTLWLQYFGNTRFAYNLSLDRDPKLQTMYYYAQGLHAGIDFGNDNLPGVVAGVKEIVQGVFRNSTEYTPNYVIVKIDKVTIFYGHVYNIPDEIVKGSVVQPTTKIAEIAPRGAQGSPHLHLEIRYSGTKIMNPLLFMPDTMRTALMQKFSDYERHFYRDATWTKWLTPLDQPVLQLSSKATAVLVGPLATRG